MLSILNSLRFFATVICTLAVLSACGAGSSPQILRQTNPVPAVSTLVPSSAASGSPALTLTVSGSDFVAASTVNWDGVALANSYVDASHLTATVPASDLTTVGAANVTVFNPTPGGGTSSALTFTINTSNPVPAVSTLVPSNAATGSPALTLTVSGSGFVAASSVNWNGVALTTSYVDASHLTATVPASGPTAVGSATLFVFNPTPGGGTSSALTFTINASNPVPAISTLVPSSAALGSLALTLNGTGGNFVAASTVNWNGVALTTSYVDASQLTATLPASDLTALG